MITVTDYDRNGKPIEDLSAVTVNLAEYPAIMAILLKTKNEEEVA